MIRRGTTPTHTFNLPFDGDFAKVLKVIYSQGGVKVITKSKDDCTIDGKTLAVRLTQRETLLFAPKKPVEVQVRLLTSGGDLLSSKVQIVSVQDSLDEEVLQ